MSLADDIMSLRDRTLAELSAAHDYYANTEAAWLLVQRHIRRGGKPRVRNAVTGTRTTTQQLAEKAREYLARQLLEDTFQQFVAIFEFFYFDLLRLWLLAYPQSLGTKQVDFQTVLDAPDKDAIALQVVNKELTEIAYKRPRDWFAYLESRVRLVCPTAEEINRITEAKASRDVLAHNRGIANKVYESKAGTLARFRDGERMEIPEPYHRAVWELIRKVVADVADAVAAKQP